MTVELERVSIGGVWQWQAVSEGGGGGGVSEITSDDETVTITNPSGPTVDLSVSGGSQPFTPDLLTGLVLWLDATSIEGIGDQDPVPLWPDLSGSGNDAEQADSEKQPVWTAPENSGFPGVLFDGSDDVLLTDGPTLPDALTLAVACQKLGEIGMSNTQQAALATADSGGTGYGPYVEAADDGAGNTVWGNPGPSLIPIVGAGPNGGALVRTAYNTTVAPDVVYLSKDEDGIVESAVNRTARVRGSDTWNGLAGVSIGADPAAYADPWTGVINEVVVYNRALTPDERNRLLGYLLNKWGTG